MAEGPAHACASPRNKVADCLEAEAGLKGLAPKANYINALRIKYGPDGLTLSGTSGGLDCGACPQAASRRNVSSDALASMILAALPRISR